MNPAAGYEHCQTSVVHWAGCERFEHPAVLDIYSQDGARRSWGCYLPGIVSMYQAPKYTY
jgi:hypothetical protein